MTGLASITTSSAISFTAARDLGPVGGQVIVHTLAQLPDAARYITGGATGGDEIIGRWLAEHRPYAQHVVLVPANRSQVSPWWTGPRFAGLVTVVELPPKTSYADRNQLLVFSSTHLVGLPAHPETSQHSISSGSWQAIRMARRAGKLALWQCIHPPFTWGTT